MIERSSCAHVPVVEKPRVASHSGYDIARLTKLTRDLDAFGLTRRDFTRLSHDGMGLFEFVGLVSMGGKVSAVTVARLEALLEKRQAHVRHDDAISAVLGEFPDELHWPSLSAARPPS